MKSKLIISALVLVAAIIGLGALRWIPMQTQDSTQNNNQPAGKRQAPKEVEPVTYGDRYFTAKHSSFVKGNEYTGGHVQAYSNVTKELLWDAEVYPGQRTDSELEADVQDVFITQLSIKDNQLLVTDELNRVFTLDPQTGQVIHGQ